MSKPRSYRTLVADAEAEYEQMLVEDEAQRAIAVDYDEYIASPMWARRKREAIECAGRRCQLCGESNAMLEVHHNTYAHLGNERPADLCVLCVPCHETFHDRRAVAGSRRPR